MINRDCMERLAKEKVHTESLSAAYEKSRIRKSKIVDATIAGRIDRLADGLDATCSPEDAHRIMLNITAIVREPSVLDILGFEARMHLENPLYSTAAQVVDGGTVSGLVLHRHPLLRITCATTSSSPQMTIQPGNMGGSGSMAVGGYDSLVMFVQASDCCVETFEIDRSLEGKGALRSPELRRIQSGSHLFMEGGREGFILTSPQGRATMVLCSRLLPRDPLSRLYDRKSLKLLKVSSASVRDSRLQNLATALAHLSGEQNRAALEVLTHHSTYFVRWHALRELASIDEELATARIQEMAEEDPHEEIRDLCRELSCQRGDRNADTHH